MHSVTNGNTTHTDTHATFYIRIEYDEYWSRHTHFRTTCFERLPIYFQGLSLFLHSTGHFLEVLALDFDVHKVLFDELINNPQLSFYNCETQENQ